MERRAAAVLVLAALAVAAAGCGDDDGGSGTAAPKAATVKIASFKYAPPTVTVSAGDSVTWTNRDMAPHTATAQEGTFDTDTLRTGQSRTVKLGKPGTYAYYCSFHRFMVGKVVVE